MSTYLTNNPAAAETAPASELFYFAYRAFTAQADRQLAGIGLGRVHHRILYFVGRHPDLPVNALIDILGVSKQALNAPMRELLARGLLLATPDEQDRRIRRLSLSATGSELENALSAGQSALLDAAFASVGSEGEGAWRKIMATLAGPAALSSLPETAKPA